MDCHYSYEGFECRYEVGGQGFTDVIDVDYAVIEATRFNYC